MAQHSIVIGMGIGELYRTVLTNLGITPITVDSDVKKGADFLTIQSAIDRYEHFSTAHVCTPNFLHEEHARKIADFADIVFVEKPGLRTAALWQRLINDYPKTRFIMVKNNQYRSQILNLQLMARNAKTIFINWNNKNRVPKPGSWFTNRDLAWGGVSRDLLPHLLSWIQVLFPDTWNQASLVGDVQFQNWTLKDLEDSDYGDVDLSGIYNVDDYASATFMYKGIKIKLTTTWRNLEDDKRNIEMTFDDDTKLTYDFGLCPEYAYQAMIKTCIENKNHGHFWEDQLKKDLWIHSIVEKY